ncbi:unnamed protein product [Gordionus sp. m RMFG-2023]|uniref:autophagy-related protein 2 homolog B-like isoform X2 n=1 Tax=Gordionus sp. m RMFG-2023 TaxID=3053472 RepID=UPI0030DE284B
MPWYFPWSDSIVLKAYRYLLNRYLGYYISEKLLLDQLDINLSLGTSSIKDVNLNSENINNVLMDNAIPFVLIDGYIKSINFAIPWSTIIYEPSEIEIKDFDIFIKPKFLNRGLLNISNSLTMSDSLRLVQEYLESDINSSELLHQSNFEGLELFAKTLESILTRIKLKITNLNIYLCYSSCDNEIFNKQYKISISNLQFYDSHILQVPQNINTKTNGLHDIQDTPIDHFYKKIIKFSPVEILVDNLACNEKRKDSNSTMYQDTIKNKNFLPILYCLFESQLSLTSKTDEKNIKDPNFEIDCQISPFVMLVAPSTVVDIIKILRMFNNPTDLINVQNESSERSMIPNKINNNHRSLNDQFSSITLSPQKGIDSSFMSRYSNNPPLSCEEQSSTDPSILTNKSRSKSEMEDQANNLTSFNLLIPEFKCILLYEDFGCAKSGQEINAVLSLEIETFFGRLRATYHGGDMNSGDKLYREAINMDLLALGRDHLCLETSGLHFHFERNQFANDTILSQILVTALSLELNESLYNQGWDAQNFRKTEDTNDTNSHKIRTYPVLKLLSTVEEMNPHLKNEECLRFDFTQFISNSARKDAKQRLDDNQDIMRPFKIARSNGGVNKKNLDIKIKAIIYECDITLYERVQILLYVLKTFSSSLAAKKHLYDDFLQCNSSQTFGLFNSTCGKSNSMDIKMNFSNLIIKIRFPYCNNRKGKIAQQNYVSNNNFIWWKRQLKPQSLTLHAKNVGLVTVLTIARPYRPNAQNFDYNIVPQKIDIDFCGLDVKYNQNEENKNESTSILLLTIDSLKSDNMIYRPNIHFEKNSACTDTTKSDLMYFSALSSSTPLFQNQSSFTASFGVNADRYRLKDHVNPFDDEYFYNSLLFNMNMDPSFDSYNNDATCNINDEGKNYKEENINTPSPFTKKRIIYENKPLILPGSQEEMRNFIRHHVAQCLFSIDIYIPTLELLMPSKNLYELLYNKIYNDLLLWIPTTPFYDLNNQYFNCNNSQHHLDSQQNNIDGVTANQTYDNKEGSPDLMSNYTTFSDIIFENFGLNSHPANLTIDNSIEEINLAKRSHIRENSISNDSYSGKTNFNLLPPILRSHFCLLTQIDKAHILLNSLDHGEPVTKKVEENLDDDGDLHYKFYFDIEDCFIFTTHSRIDKQHCNPQDILARIKDLKVNFSNLCQESYVKSDLSSKQPFDNPLFIYRNPIPSFQLFAPKKVGKAISHNDSQTTPLLCHHTSQSTNLLDDINDINDYKFDTPSDGHSTNVYHCVELNLDGDIIEEPEMMNQTKHPDLFKLMRHRAVVDLSNNKNSRFGDDCKGMKIESDSDKMREEDMLALASKSRFNRAPGIKETILTVAVHNSIMNHEMSHKGRHWYNCIHDFFSLNNYADYKIAPLHRLNQLHLQFFDCGIVYRPIHIPYKVYIELGSLIFSNSALVILKASELKLIIEDSSLYISNKIDHELIDLINDYIKVAMVGLFEITIKKNNFCASGNTPNDEDSKTQPKISKSILKKQPSQKSSLKTDSPFNKINKSHKDYKNNKNEYSNSSSHIQPPNFEMRAINDKLIISTCYDSCIALQKILTYYSSDGDLITNISLSSTSVNPVIPENLFEFNHIECNETSTAFMTPMDSKNNINNECKSIKFRNRLKDCHGNRNPNAETKHSLRSQITDLMADAMMEDDMHSPLKHNNLTESLCKYPTKIIDSSNSHQVNDMASNTNNQPVLNHSSYIVTSEYSSKEQSSQRPRTKDTIRQKISHNNNLYLLSDSVKSDRDPCDTGGCNNFRTKYNHKECKVTLNHPCQRPCDTNNRGRIGRKFFNLNIEDNFVMIDNEESFMTEQFISKPEMKIISHLNCQEISPNKLLVENYFVKPTFSKFDHLKTPSSFPTPIDRYLFGDISVKWELFGGRDFDMETNLSSDDISTKVDINIPQNFVNYKSSLSSPRHFRTSSTLSSSPKMVSKKCRNKNVLMEIHLNKIRFQYEKFPPHATQVSRQVLSIQEFQILDKLTSSHYNKFLYLYVSDIYPKKSNAPMLLIKALHTKPEINLPTQQECILKVSLQPIRLNMDQEALIFLKDFFQLVTAPLYPQDTEEFPINSSNSCSTPPIMKVNSVENLEGLFSNINEVSNLNELNNRLEGLEGELSSKATSPIFFRPFIFSPDVPIKIDYRGKFIDLGQGTFIGLLMALAQLNCSEIKLKKLYNSSGILSIEKLLNYIIKEWLTDIKNNQLKGILSGIGPMHSFVQLAQGVKDLVYLPIQQYRKDRRIIKGLKRGASSFTSLSAISTIELSYKFVEFLKTAAETTYIMLSPENERNSLVSYSNYSSRFEGSNEIYFRPSKNLMLDIRPLDIRDGVSSAYHLVKEGFSQTALDMIKRAALQHEIDGLTGVAGSLIRDIPRGIMRPALATAKATSTLLDGVKHSFVPQARKDSLDKWKKYPHFISL